MGDRAVSTVLSYALILGIVAILTATLFVSTSGFVENERKETVRSTLEVTGHALAADVETADRLAASAGEPGRVALASDLPDRVAGAQYEIEIDERDDEDRYEITLRSVDPEVSVTVLVRTETPIEPTAVDGGDVAIEFDPSTSEGVVIRNV